MRRSREWERPSARINREARRCQKQLVRSPSLWDTGGLAKKDRITHRIEISFVEQIDDEVKKWLKTAYDLDQ